ncbi:MAG: methionyl-tRNA formyltransferase [Bacilli bacterium]|nr:methionyl-tRNA formyltransferase [Bacilli bacterium]
MTKEPVIVFMGTPDFSATVLEGLLLKYPVRAIVTQPDKPVGRGGKIKFSPVKEIALKNDILCLQPDKVEDILQDINVMNPDIIITCAYGKMLPLELLVMPKFGCINVHASLLPKLRGGAPIHHAIIDGYKETGVTIMYMSSQMDAGDIISQEKVSISEDETAESLHDKLMVLGRDLLLNTLPSIFNKTNKRIKQDESLVTYGFVITREDEYIDFNKPKRTIINQIRGLNSWPGAYCYYEDKIMKVWEARRGDKYDEHAYPGEIIGLYDDGFGVKVLNGEVVFTVIQPESKGKMKASDFINGHANLLGKVLK